MHKYTMHLTIARKSSQRITLRDWLINLEGGGGGGGVVYIVYLPSVRVGLRAVP